MVKSFANRKQNYELRARSEPFEQIIYFYLLYRLELLFLFHLGGNICAIKIKCVPIETTREKLKVEVNHFSGNWT